MILSEKHDEFLEAFFRARGMISGTVKKNSTNPHLKSNYADLNSVFETINPALQDCGLILIQNSSTCETGDAVDVFTTVMHVSGQYANFVSRIPLTKKDAPSFGSTQTYGRRYSTLGIFGLVPADDDGNATRRTAKDVKRMLDRAEDVPAMNKIMETSVQYFADDITSLNVIRAHYDKLKADMVVGNAEPFRPLQPKQKPQQQSDKTESPKGDNIEPEINF